MYPFVLCMHVLPPHASLVPTSTASCASTRHHAFPSYTAVPDTQGHYGQQQSQPHMPPQTP